MIPGRFILSLLFPSKTLAYIRFFCFKASTHNMLEVSNSSCKQNSAPLFLNSNLRKITAWIRTQRNRAKWKRESLAIERMFIDNYYTPLDSKICIQFVVINRIELIIGILIS